jgi:hypothetical protein
MYRRHFEDALASRILPWQHSQPISFGRTPLDVFLYWIDLLRLWNFGVCHFFIVLHQGSEKNQYMQ